MKLNRTVFYTMCSLLIGISCSKNNSSPKDCGFGTDAPSKLTADGSVEYLAGVSGAGGTITQLSYLDSAGVTTIDNPSLPWTKTVNLKSGVLPTISAHGTANKGGQLNISIVLNGAQTGNQCGN